VATRRILYTVGDACLARSLDRDGMTVALMKTQKPKVLLAREAPFSVDRLREFFERTVLGKNRLLKMPGEAELKELTRILNFWYENYYQPWLAPIRQEQRRAIKALEAAEQAILEVKKCNSCFAATAASGLAPPFVHAILEKRLADIQSRLNDVARIKQASFLTDFEVYDWTWIAPVLIVDFENAMRPANPSARFGSGNGGPLARFLAEVLTVLTGKSIKPTSMSALLKKNKMRERPLAADTLWEHGAGDADYEAYANDITYSEKALPRYDARARKPLERGRSDVHSGLWREGSERRSQP
jgi:hypothetical protein